VGVVFCAIARSYHYPGGYPCLGLPVEATSAGTFVFDEECEVELDGFAAAYTVGRVI
jgi:hypothetical protein